MIPIYNQQVAPPHKPSRLGMAGAEARAKGQLAAGLEKIGSEFAGNLFELANRNQINESLVKARQDWQSFRSEIQKDPDYSSYGKKFESFYAGLREDLQKGFKLPGARREIEIMLKEKHQDWSEEVSKISDERTIEAARTIFLQGINQSIRDLDINQLQSQLQEAKNSGTFEPADYAKIEDTAIREIQHAIAQNGAMRVMQGTGDIAAVKSWLEQNTPFYEKDLETRSKILRDVGDYQDWLITQQRQAVRAQSEAAFEKVYSDIQAGKVATFEEIDANPMLTVEDKIRADAFRRAWLVDQHKERGPPSAFDVENEDFNKAKQEAQTEVDKKTLTRDYLEAVNKKWGQTKEGGELVRYLETQLGQIEIERKQQAKEREAADATKTTSPDCLVYFHDSFYREDNTPDDLRKLLSWVRDNFLPSADAPTVPRVGTDKKQQWEGMINAEIKRLEGGPYKQKKAQIERGRKDISDFWEPKLNDAKKIEKPDEYKKLLGDRDKMLQTFDSQAEEVKDIPALVNEVLEPSRIIQVRDAYTGKMRPEIPAEHWQRVGLPEKAPQPYRPKSTAPTHVYQQSAPAPGAQQTATEIADRKIVSQYANYRKTTGNQLALVQMPDKSIRAYDNKQKTWVPVDPQSIRLYYDALRRLRM